MKFVVIVKGGAGGGTLEPLQGNGLVDCVGRIDTPNGDALYIIRHVAHRGINARRLVASVPASLIIYPRFDNPHPVAQDITPLAYAGVTGTDSARAIWEKLFAFHQNEDLHPEN
jgi:hypothetical protein